MGTSSNAPKNAAAKRNIVIDDTVRLRCLYSRRSSSGCSGRNACQTNVTISRTPTSIESHTRGAVMSPFSCGRLETPNRNRASPGESSSMPTKSKDSEGCGASVGRTTKA